MAQSVSQEYTERMADPSKRVDYAFVISGWPTVYTVAQSGYTAAGDLANFTSFRSVMDLPRFAGAKCKGRPEEGKTSIGEMGVKIQDRLASGTREMTDLASRFSYLLDDSTGNEDTVDGNMSRSITTITVDSTAGFASSGNIYIGQECIKYTGTNGTQFTGCTRGYLLTPQMEHRDGVKVYDYLPNLYRRLCFLYKGTQDLTLDKWAPAFGGCIVADRKMEAGLALTCEDATWWYYQNQTAMILNPWKSPFTADTVPPFSGKLSSDLDGTTYTQIQFTFPILGGLNDGHWIMNMGGEWMAVRSAS